MRKNKQSARSLTAFIVTWAFLILTVTGIVLYVVPQGRVAYWVHWSLLGMEKEQWSWVHLMFGGMFIISGVLHLYYNWKPFKKYFADRINGHFQPKREVFVATALTLFVFITAALNLPPSSWVIDLNEQIKSSWITSPELEPPFGHAEEASLAGISKKMGLDVDAGLAALRGAGIQFNGSSDRLEDVARRNQITPMEVYELLLPHKKVMVPRLKKEPLTAAEIEAKYSGTGLGRKTVAEVSKEIGTPLQSSLSMLKAAGIEAKAEEKMRAVAERSQRTPVELLTLILGER